MVRNAALIAAVSFGGLLCGRLAEAQVRTGAATSGTGGVSSSAGGTSVVTDSQSRAIVGGPPGASVGRIQPSLLRAPAVDVGPVQALPSENMLPGTNVPVVRRPGSTLKEPDADDDADNPIGITLSEAAYRLVHDNLDLRTRFSDISQADSDVLTASLRTNPIVYADTQQVPYGSYSQSITGGPTQFDINVVYPLDLSHKRQARTRSAVVARQLVEASFRDSVRLTMDNLYGAYVDALAAQRQYERAIGKLKDDLSVAPVDEPAQGLWDAQRKLALLINMPTAEVARRQLKGRISIPLEEATLPPLAESVRIALENRPDVAAGRLAVYLADTNVKAVLANRFDDVLLLAQPFTLKSGAPFDQKNSVAWAIGMTIPLPIYNRQQGNLIKARQIAEQARTRLQAIEQGVASEVQGAYLEHDSVHQAWKRTLNDFKEYSKGTEKLSTMLNLDEERKKKLESLEKQFEELRNDALYEKLNKCYDAIVRHRKSQLRINTVTATKLSQ